MNRITLTDDIKPITEFRSNAKILIAQVHKTKRPLVITQNGKSAAVLLDVHEYEKLLNTIEVQNDLFQAEEQVKNKETLPSKQARKSILSRLVN